MKTISIKALAFAASALVLLSCSDKDDPYWVMEDDFLSQELETKTEYGTSVKTENKLAIGNKAAYPIGSVFVGGAVADPTKGSSHRCRFYQEAYTNGPNWDLVPAMVFIGGFRYTGTEYTKPGQYINLIAIYGLDPSLRLGESLSIPMDQGVYKGGCDLVKDVYIKSYRFSSYTILDSESGRAEPNDDADIDIRILCKNGDVISILFKGKTPYDGYI